MDALPTQAIFSGNPAILTEAYGRGRLVQYGQPLNPDLTINGLQTDLIHAADGSSRSPFEFLLKLEELDLSENNLSGPLFTWGWPGPDANGNYDALAWGGVHKPSPVWPLKEIKLTGNPLRMSVGFLLAQETEFERRKT